MPLTPRFRLSQTSTHLTVTIHIPHIRVSASTIEVVVDGCEIHFFSSPYLLHLTFPQNNRLLDDVESCREAKAVYDPTSQNGVLKLDIWKEEEGFWDDLDLLGRLIMKNDFISDSTTTSTSSVAGVAGVAGSARNNKEDSSNNTSFGKIKVLSSTTEGECNERKEESSDLSTSKKQHKRDNDQDEFSFEDTTTEDDLQSFLKPHYGFLNMFHSVFTAYAREGISHDMLELPCPDETLAENRRELRLVKENETFDPERFLGDLNLVENYDDAGDDDNVDMIFMEALHLQPHWLNTYEVSNKSAVDEVTSGIQKLSTQDIDVGTANKTNDGTGNGIKETTTETSSEFFTSDESLQMTTIQAKIPDMSRISKEQTQSLLLSLMDILYAYAYDHRTTSADPTCESSWTIVTLSPTLSWFESYIPPYDDISQILRWCIRRGLTYPYLRNYKFLSEILVKDVSRILHGGRRVVLRCLLQIRIIMDKSEFHYLFNKIYIDPFICWIQLVEEKTVLQFASEVDKVLKNEKYAFDKLDLGLDDVVHNATLDAGGENSNDEDSSSSSGESSSSEESIEFSSDDDESSSSEEEEEKEGNLLLSDGKKELSQSVILHCSPHNHEEIVKEEEHLKREADCETKKPTKVLIQEIS